MTRMQRITEFIITGVPATENESCISIATKIASTINCILNVDTIRAFRLQKTAPLNLKKRLRNGDTKNPAIIMVKFPSTVERNDFFKKYLAYENLNLKDLGFQSTQRVYVKENLTPHNYKIFQACDGAKRDGVIDKFFTRDGICHIMLQGNDKPIIIHSLQFFYETVNTTFESSRAPKQTSKVTNSKKSTKKQRMESNALQPSNQPCAPVNQAPDNQSWAEMES
ncbi:hypothetical protein Bhyg_02299 [Pseudolycoriella hygida]|uniref:Uncharacterized protein n=1 Tax=Pseudolycoriella hygida TaxID=35572 RepID=A0A9Q0S6I8_9DIPT|nr:hypothetical protein Bhyg_02299 [Pseudolycoriella hygida]